MTRALLAWLLVGALTSGIACSEPDDVAPQGSTLPFASERPRPRPRPTALVESSAMPTGDVGSLGSGEASAEPALAASVDPSGSALPSAAPSASSASGPGEPGKPKRLLVRGYGLWIWDFERNAPRPQAAADLAKELGVRRVFIKSGEGDSRERWAKNFSEKNVEPFVRHGIEVWGFAYLYPDHHKSETGRDYGSLEAQADATVAALVHPGVAGLIVDAEMEFYDKPEDATKLCALLRKKWKKRLGYTTFGWIKPNRKFPFAAFDRGCGDVFMPQVYYAFGWPGGVDGSLDRLTEELAPLKLKAPVWPVQSNEKNPSLADLRRFFERAGGDASVFYLHAENAPQNERLRALSIAR